MKRSLLSILAVTLCASASMAGERYRVQDKGGFASTGRHIEFANRYGWKSYEVDFDFAVDLGSRRLKRRSALKLTVHRKDGSTWSYRCKGSDRERMWANINKLYGKGISVLTECRIKPKQFAKVVNLDADLVGDPTLVFHVMVNKGDARVGVQKGIYFLRAGQIEASTLNQYATQVGDPANLGVLFASAGSQRGYYSSYGASPRLFP